MMRRAFAAIVIPAVLLCGCGRQVPDSRQEAPAEETTEYKDKDELVSEWMADETQTEPITAAAGEEIDDGATPLDAFEYTIREDGTAAILKYTGKDTAVVITSHIGDTPVTEIGQYAFEAAWDVQEIVLPDSVHFIGEQAFLDCESLTAVNIPSVPVLYRATFAGCTSLSSVTIPASVTETYEELFSGCPIQDLYVENAALTYESWGLEDAPCTVHAPEGAAIFDWAQSAGKSTAVIGGEPPLADAS